MKKWLMRMLGIYRKKNEALLEIIERLTLLNLSASDRDDVVDAVSKALDRQFD